MYGLTRLLKREQSYRTHTHLWGNMNMFVLTWTEHAVLTQRSTQTSVSHSLDHVIVDTAQTQTAQEQNRCYVYY